MTQDAEKTAIIRQLDEKANPTGGEIRCNK
jgi:hypothetical protein